MRNTIKNALAQIDIIIRTSGDGWLPEEYDPFRYDDHSGAKIYAKSAENQHLTWGILGTSLKGLQECVIRNAWFQDAIFQIFDGAWGHVGNGYIVKSGPGAHVMRVE